MAPTLGVHEKHDPWSKLNDGERFALWALRRIFAGPILCDGGTLASMKGNGWGLAPAVSAFRRLMSEAPEWTTRNSAGFLAAGYLDLTRYERRWLRALSAAQADQCEIVDHYLCKLAPERGLREMLAQAVHALAAALAVQGLYLPRPMPNTPLPGGALRVARCHAYDLSCARVLWP